MDLMVFVFGINLQGDDYNMHPILHLTAKVLPEIQVLKVLSVVL